MGRASQVGFFALFMYFLFQTAFRGTFAASADQAVRLPLPVEAFLLADPFVAAMTALSTHTVYRGLLWSVGLLALTLVFGRVFCGWICPFGTLHHFFGWLFPSTKGRGAHRVEANKTHGYQRAKYYLLYAFLARGRRGQRDRRHVRSDLRRGALDRPRRDSGGAVPRGRAALRRRDARSVARAAERRRSHAGLPRAHRLAVATSRTSTRRGSSSFLLVGVLFMNRFIPRFWCRVLCPLGAFLGVFSRFALFGMEKDHAKCTDCNLCLVHCQGADSPQGGVKWRQDECHMCLNCETACPEDVIKFRFLPNRKSAHREARHGAPHGARRGGRGRRCSFPASRIADSLDVNYNEKVIRPPGAVEERQFLERCIRCAECMKVCPNNALHPAFFEAGIEGMWTPILIARIGYCEHSCVLCGQVCPTGAIQKITEKQKIGIGRSRPSRSARRSTITAAACRGRWQTPCIVCEEFCPTSPKAIWVEEVEVPVRDSNAGTERRAAGDEDGEAAAPARRSALCIGCGACEKVCPVQDQPAVYVTSVGETRRRRT